ncbi:hypothetical protein CLF_103639 [Clonorchis sinensis]|uniref:Uncharacterized protein n=1 Tax=Clonorchis sinensis TaxID=79923 RepID=G7YA34_CLOSI|nr:hypothetical protein CLF_103639 [Clonorchis sinensis]
MQQTLNNDWLLNPHFRPIKARFVAGPKSGLVFWPVACGLGFLVVVLPDCGCWSGSDAGFHLTSVDKIWRAKAPERSCPCCIVEWTRTRMIPMNHSVLTNFQLSNHVDYLKKQTLQSRTTMLRQLCRKHALSSCHAAPQSHACLWSSDTNAEKALTFGQCSLSTPITRTLSVQFDSLIPEPGQYKLISAAIGGPQKIWAKWVSSELPYEPYGIATKRNTSWCCYPTHKDEQRQLVDKTAPKCPKSKQMHVYSKSMNNNKPKRSKGTTEQATISSGRNFRPRIEIYVIQWTDGGRNPHRATNLAAGLKFVDCGTRFMMLDLFALEYRRLREDLILTYALFEQGFAIGFFSVDPAIIITINIDSMTSVFNTDASLPANTCRGHKPVPDRSHYICSPRPSVSIDYGMRTVYNQMAAIVL